jgi:hypothetical protein
VASDVERCWRFPIRVTSGIVGLTANAPGLVSGVRVDVATIVPAADIWQHCAAAISEPLSGIGITIIAECESPATIAGIPCLQAINAAEGRSAMAITRPTATSLECEVMLRMTV